MKAIDGKILLHPGTSFCDRSIPHHCGDNLNSNNRRITNIRTDALHKLTTWLAKNHSEVVIEDFNISGMLKNHRLASAIADCGFYEFKRQLTYKTARYGATLIEVDRFYPSSQICSCCYHRQKMPNRKLTFVFGSGFSANSSECIWNSGRCNNYYIPRISDRTLTNSHRWYRSNVSAFKFSNSVKLLGRLNCLGYTNNGKF